MEIGISKANLFVHPVFHDLENPNKKNIRFNPNLKSVFPWAFLPFFLLFPHGNSGLEMIFSKSSPYWTRFGALPSNNPSPEILPLSQKRISVGISNHFSYCSHGNGGSERGTFYRCYIGPAMAQRHDFLLFRISHHN